MKKTIIIVLICYALQSHAQVDYSKDFVYLKSDSMLYANRVSLRPNLLGEWEVRADSRKVATNSVKFFNNRHGFFANIGKPHLFSQLRLVERLIEGEINLYEEIDYDPDLFSRQYGRRYAESASMDMNMYYSRGFGDLHKVKYENLRVDLADNPESMKWLEEYRSSKNNSRIMFIAGVVSVTAGVVSALVAGSKHIDFHSDEEPNYTPGLVLFGLGVGLGGGWSIFHHKGLRSLQKAIDSYNQ